MTANYTYIEKNQSRFMDLCLNRILSKDGIMDGKILRSMNAGGQIMGNMWSLLRNECSLKEKNV